MKQHPTFLQTVPMSVRTLLLGFFFILLILHLTMGLGKTAQTEGDASRSILILATNHVSEAKLMELRELGSKTNLSIDYKFLRTIKEGDSLQEIVAPYRLVIFDSVSGHEAKTSYSRFADTVRASRDIAFVPVKIRGDSELRSGISSEHAQLLHDYYDNGGPENFRRMLIFLESAIFRVNDATPSPPIIFPPVGIYHPDYEKVVFGSLSEYRDWKPVASTEPVIGIAMTKDAIASNQTQLIDHLIHAIEARGGTALPFYFVASPRGAPDFLSLLKADGRTVADMIINTRILHWAEARKTEFEKLEIPVIQALPYSAGDQAEWEADMSGIPANVIPFFLTFAEIAGVIDPIVVSATDEETKRQTPIDYQIRNLLDKAFNLAALRHMPNAEKKVAVMFYNYPAGEKSAGASFLDIPGSLAQISRALEGTGYRVSPFDEETFPEKIGHMLKPFYRNLSYAELLEHDVGGLLPLQDYLAWYDDLPESIRADIENHWGKPEDSFTVVERNGQRHFVVPRLLLGNLMILPQPPRGNNRDREKQIYHSQKMPISHTYLAGYLYTREQFEADAIVHLGTHGTHEWLPGKERGLSMYDPGNLTAGSTPIIYPYIVDDVGEALQTKRRGRATVISHATPPLGRAGLYKDLAEIHELEYQYKHLDPGPVKDRTRTQIIDLVVEQNIHDDLGWKREAIEEQFAEFLWQLHNYLHDLAEENQPLGLHTYGTVAADNHLTSTLVQMLGDSYVTLANKLAVAGSLNLASENGDALIFGGNTPMRYDEFEHTPEYRLVKTHVVEGVDPAETTSSELRGFLEKAREYYANLLGQRELKSLTMALEGKYIPTSTGGGPINNPESLPTGRNLYGFDPTKIPTKAAYESGKELMDSLIADFYYNHSRYPTKVTFNLWSIETMRHLGVLESQILHAIGAKPVWDDNGKVIGTEIVPFSELRRPRVDVVASPTGLYRDAFPNVMTLISKAIEQVAQLQEDDNFVAQHSARIEQDLLESGIEPEEAETLSTIRFFSNERGEYGSGLETASLASDTWETDEKLANLYLDRMGYIYGPDEKTWGKKLPDIDLYGKNLSGTDVALFSRSSNIYGMMTSDDPFQYFGGISLAVRNLDGKSPEMYISDLRDRDHETIGTLDEFIAKELRSRYFHPQWIAEMQEEGYSGTLAVQDTVNNFWGWQVVDPQSIRDDQWQMFHDIYVEDVYDMNMREWFEKHNPEALAKIVERMLEAIRKGYWAADDSTIRELTETYKELTDANDFYTLNDKFKEYLNKLALGYGLGPINLARALKSELSPTVAQQTTTVEGQVLEKVQASDQSPSPAWHLVLVLVVCVVMGFIYQTFMAEKARWRSGWTRISST